MKQLCTLFPSCSISPTFTTIFLNNLIKNLSTSILKFTNKLHIKGFTEVEKFFNNSNHLGIHGFHKRFIHGSFHLLGHGICQA